MSDQVGNQNVGFLMTRLKILSSSLLLSRKSSKEKPKWFMVDVKYERMMKRYIPLSELKKLHLKHKEHGGPLRNLALFTKARLSVQPVSAGKMMESSYYLSLVVRKPTFGVSDQVRQKPGCTATEDG